MKMPHVWDCALSVISREVPSPFQVSSKDSLASMLTHRSNASSMAWRVAFFPFVCIQKLKTALAFRLGCVESAFFSSFSISLSFMSSSWNKSCMSLTPSRRITSLISRDDALSANNALPVKDYIL